MKEKKTAAVITAGILLTAILSILSILILWQSVFGGADGSFGTTGSLGADGSSRKMTADIYQNGELVKSLPLENDTENYTITIYTADGGSNVIEVRGREIGIISADCPDKLCVRQGFRHDSLLPIICLPHRLVIQIRAAKEDLDAIAE